MGSSKVNKNSLRCPVLLIKHFGHFTQGLLMTIKDFSLAIIPGVLKEYNGQNIKE